jgi:DNA polymerase-3 subunit epsilon
MKSGSRGSASAWSAWMAGAGDQARDPRLADFYRHFPNDPSVPVADLPLIAIDLETTGLDPARHAILSIGLLPFTLSRIRLSDRRHWVLRPSTGLSGESVRFHNITHSDTERAPTMAGILTDLLNTLSGRLPVVHYHPLERRFLQRAIEQQLRQPLRFPLIDTMELEARRQRRGGLARLRQWLGRPPASLRLNDCRQRYGLPAYGAHHAVLDALATAELLQAQIQHRYDAATSVGELWV